MILRSTIFGLSLLTVVLATPFNRTINLERLPVGYAQHIPKFEINHCPPEQMDSLGLSLENAWIDTVRAFVNLRDYGATPAYTTFFKSPRLLQNVTNLFDRIVKVQGVPKPPTFHCVSENFELEPGELEACHQNQGPIGFRLGSANISICPALFDFPVGDAYGNKNDCPIVEKNSFVGQQNYTGGFPRTWSNEILGIIIAKYVENASGEFGTNKWVSTFNLEWDQVHKDVVPDDNDLNRSVWESVDESKTNPLNYMFYALFVNNDCAEVPNIMAPPWSFVKSSAETGFRNIDEEPDDQNG